jgi:hypothetical protein
MQFVKFECDDVLIMKKKHPCGSDSFRVARLGSDIRIICLVCSRDLTIARERLEKSIKKVVPSKSNV